MLRLLRILVFGLFLLGVGTAVAARDFLMAGIFVAGLFLFFGWWLRADVEKCGDVASRGVR